MLGFCSGVVAGLVVITPGAGFVTADERGHHRRARGRRSVPRLHQAQGACSATTTRSTPSACTRVGGTLGALLTGVFATPDVNANLNTNLKDIVGKTLWLEQLKAIGVTLVLAVVGTVVLGYAVKARSACGRPTRTRRRVSTSPITASAATRDDRWTLPARHP